MGAKESTSTTTNTPPPYVAAAYQDLLKQAKPISNTPYTPFAGGSSNDIQRTAQQQFANLSGHTNDNFTSATDLLNTTAVTPTSSLIGQYENPYQQDVINATMANIGETNAQQQQQVKGNAILKGAMGGDRVAVAQSELARQQGLAGNATLANLNAQNYSQALTAAQAQKSQAVEQAGAMGTVGQAENNAGLQNAAAYLSAGDSQYARDYAQYQASKSYPFETTGWLANIVEGIGAGAGGTQTSTTPSGNTGSSILGGVLSMASLLSDERVKENKQVIGKTFDGQPIYRFNYKGDPRTQMGLMAQKVEKDHPEAVNENAHGLKFVDYHQATDEAAHKKGFAGGGVIPSPYMTDQTGLVGMASPGDTLGGGYVPAVTPIAPRSTMPTGAPSAQKQPDPLDAITNKAMADAQQKGMSNIKGLVHGQTPTDGLMGYLQSKNAPSTLPQEAAHAGANGVAPVAAATPAAATGVAPVSNVVALPTAASSMPVVAAAAAPAAAEGAGGIAGLMHLFGFSEGGVVRRAYAGGGNTGDWQAPPLWDWLSNDNEAQVGAPAPAVATPVVMPRPSGWPDVGVAPVVTTGGVAAPAGMLPASGLYDPSPSVSGADIGSNGMVRRLPAPAPFDQSRPLAGAMMPQSNTDKAAFDDQTSFGAPGESPAAPATRGWVAKGIPAVDQPSAVVPVAAAPASNGVAPVVPPLGAPIDVATVPEAGMTRRQANADNPAAPVGNLSPRDALRVEQNKPIAVARLPGAAPAGAQNWVGTFQSAGLPPMQAAILAGNIQQESGFNTGSINPKEGAHGVLQWRLDRWDGLKNYAANYPGGARDWRDPQVQANYLVKVDSQQPAQKAAWDQFLAAKDPATANAAMKKYIRYGDDTQGTRLQNGLALMGNPAPASYPPTMTALNGKGGNDTTGSITPAANGVAPVAASAGDSGGIFGTGDLLQKIGLHLTDNQRTALLSAGLGMMAGTSPNFLTNVGTGGLKGVEQMNTLKQQGFEGSRVGLEGKRVDIAAGQLANEAARTKADVGLIETETGAKKWVVEPKMAGLMVRSTMDPTQSYMVPWDQVPTSPIAQRALAGNEAPAAPAATPATTPAAAPAPAPKADAAPAVGSALPPADQARLAAISPAGVAGAPAAMPPAPSGPVSLIPPLPARLPMDGRGFTEQGMGLIKEEASAAMKKAQEEYQGAQKAQVQLSEMKHDLAALPESNWLAPGAGFQKRLDWANTINTGLRMAGLPSVVSPNEVAAGQDLNKLTTRLGFELSNSLGSNEAGMIVERAVGAVPGGANSPEGAARVIKGIEAANQRKVDYYQFLQNWQLKTGGSVAGADQAFNAANPPEMYALMTVIDPRAMVDLRHNPKDLAAPFAQKFGKQALQVVLGAQGGQ